MTAAAWYSSTFSEATLAELAEVVSRTYTHTQLNLLVQRLDAEHADEDEWGNVGNKLQRSMNLVRALNSRDEDEGSGVLELLRELLENRLQDRVVDETTGQTWDPLRRLIDSLRADGYEFANGRLLPTTPGPASIAPEISLVEHELSERQLNVAQRHYRQAVDSYLDGRLEASNGQLRSCVENVLIELGEEATGRRSADPKAAVDRLRNGGFIDGDEARLLQGLVGVSNERGAHHGLTDEAEATFRLHATTAVVRYLLARIESPE